MTQHLPVTTLFTWILHSSHNNVITLMLVAWAIILLCKYRCLCTNSLAIQHNYNFGRLACTTRRQDVKLPPYPPYITIKLTNPVNPTLKSVTKNRVYIKNHGKYIVIKTTSISVIIPSKSASTSTKPKPTYNSKVSSKISCTGGSTTYKGEQRSTRVFSQGHHRTFSLQIFCHKHYHHQITINGNGI